MYPEKLFQSLFFEQFVLEIFVIKGNTGLSFWEIIAWKNFQKIVKVFINKPPHGCDGFNILILKYSSEKWEQIYHFSLKCKTVKGNSVAIFLP